jgi:hypothetical protein
MLSHCKYIILMQSHCICSILYLCARWADTCRVILPRIITLKPTLCTLKPALYTRRRGTYSYWCFMILWWWLVLYDTKMTGVVSHFVSHYDDCCCITLWWLLLYHSIMTGAVSHYHDHYSTIQRNKQEAARILEWWRMRKAPTGSCTPPSMGTWPGCQSVTRLCCVLCLVVLAFVYDLFRVKVGSRHRVFPEDTCGCW